MQETALEKLIILEKDVRDFGFEWPDIDMILWQVASESDEIKEAIANKTGKDHLQEEIGDLLHTVISLCIFAGFDLEETLEKTVKKFGGRANALKVVAKQKGHDSLKGQSIEYQLELWREAKTTQCHSSEGGNPVI